MYIESYDEVPRNLSRNQTIRILKEHGIYSTTENLDYNVGCSGKFIEIAKTSFDDKFKVRETYSTRLVFDFLGY